MWEKEKLTEPDMDTAREILSNEFFLSDYEFRCAENRNKINQALATLRTLILEGIKDLRVFKFKTQGNFEYIEKDQFTQLITRIFGEER